MSFILDALKKVERDKRHSEGSQIESIAVARARFGGHQRVLSMAAIAVGSALLTAAAVSFLISNRQGTDTTATAPVALPEPRELEAPREPKELDTPPAKLESPVVVATKQASMKSRDPVPEPEPDSIEEAPHHSSQPIRLVGRERVLLNALSIEVPAGSFDHDDAEPLPSDFPDLVLQGTSVIGNNVVAVISDQRVFEGDRIEGALVIRIGEREVVLELDGRRFTLRL